MNGNVNWVVEFLNFLPRWHNYLSIVLRFNKTPCPAKNILTGIWYTVCNWKTYRISKKKNPFCKKKTFFSHKKKCFQLHTIAKYVSNTTFVLLGKLCSTLINERGVMGYPLLLSHKALVEFYNPSPNLMRFCILNFLTS